MSKSYKLLFIVGTQNQTTMMHKISQRFPDHYECYFTNFYGDGITRFFSENGLAEVTIVGQTTNRKNQAYCERHGLKYDYRGEKHDYDLVFTANDLHIPANLNNRKMMLVQEGILEPVDWRFHTCKALGWSRLLADTSMMGLSDHYEYFCVFSEGYKKEFIKRGVKEEKIRITSAPNFDRVSQFFKNDFPHKDYVLAITSNHRETRRSEDRKGLIRKVRRIANGRPVIFKLHPRENWDRAIKEINKHAPEATIYTSGNTEEMVANSSVVIASYSTVILTAAAMGKEVYSDYPNSLLQTLKPVQNGKAAQLIADLAMEIVEGKIVKPVAV